MKEPYEEMKIELVGALNDVVNKSGPDADLSQNFESKTEDEDSRPF
jgi:hypothetical protein